MKLEQEITNKKQISLLSIWLTSSRPFKNKQMKKLSYKLRKTSLNQALLKETY